MEYYLTDLLVFVGWVCKANGFRAARDNQVSTVGRGRTSVWPVFLAEADRTARSNGPNKISFDVDGDMRAMI